MAYDILAIALLGFILSSGKPLLIDQMIAGLFTDGC